MNRIKELIENKIIAIVLPGASIGGNLGGLEARILSLKRYNFCWCGINNFKLIEDNILKKKDYHMSIVQSIGEVEQWEKYERELRYPMIKEFLERPENNVLILSSEIIENFRKLSLEIDKYLSKIYVVENARKLDVPNGLTFYLQLLTLAGAKRIFLFGCDGYNNPTELEKKVVVQHYYKAKAKLEELKAMFHKDGSRLNADPTNTIPFQGLFKPLYLEYCIKNRLVPARIINCNPNSVITLFPKISYDELEKYLNESFT